MTSGKARFRDPQYMRMLDGARGRIGPLESADIKGNLGQSPEEDEFDPTFTTFHEAEETLNPKKKKKE
ncbi:MAG: hypothetical protein GF416_02110 [Candidatus Altiarchaeales archaeon]|nr:hypothetical protein [Candidatus Altiarchaeales archaeon]MBD3415912.1 hypothetical protein [Candidatus Altiarchaeales archaeon]